MIWHVVQRAQSCQHLGQVVVAMSSEASDDPLADFCADNDIAYHRGSLDNVLSRYLEVLDVYPYPYVARITGDCPLIDPGFIDRQVQALVSHDGDQLWLSESAPILCGQGVHSTRSLRKISEFSNHPDDLEHVGSRYLAEHPAQFRIVGLQPPRALAEANYRFTVDEPADYEMIRLLYHALWRGDPITLGAALDWMAAHPELACLNQRVKDSSINQEISSMRRTARQHVDLFSDWEDPSQTIPAPQICKPNTDNS
jgi:spore coat polysaccharide biosynthesis protein SpsF